MGGNTPDCGPGCTMPTKDNPDGTHCDCGSCHGKGVNPPRHG